MMRWLFSMNHKDTGTFCLIFSTLVGFAGMVMTIFILLKFSHSNGSMKSDQLYNVLTTVYTLFMAFFLSTFAFLWGFKNWLLPSMLKIMNMTNFYPHLMKISPVLSLLKKLQVFQTFVKDSFMVLYYKMFYVNQIILGLFMCVFMVIIQCILLKLGMVDFGVVAHCKGPSSSVNLTETCPQASHVNEVPPVLPDSVVIQIPSTSMGESAYEVSTNPNELISQMTNTNEVSLKIPSSETEESTCEAITNLDELNILVPLVDSTVPNSAEEPIYETIPGMSDQACCMTVTQQMECSSYMGFFVGLSFVAAFALYLVYFNGAGEMTRSCNFPDLMKQLEDIFRNL